jgi:hypothetical protein
MIVERKSTETTTAIVGSMTRRPSSSITPRYGERQASKFSYRMIIYVQCVEEKLP